MQSIKLNFGVINRQTICTNANEEGGKIMSEKISNEKIAHDLTVAYITTKYWQVHGKEYFSNVTGDYAFDSISEYHQKYDEFLKELKMSTPS